MFAKTVVLSDKFITLPIEAQALYFHAGVSAQDKGIVNNIRSLARVSGCSLDAIDQLVDAGFLKYIGNDEYEIVHWYENNGIGETAKKRNNYKYRQWRSEVIERDGHRCTKCGCTENLVAHHIKPFALYPLLRFEISNGTTLCDDCHKKLHKEARNNGRSQMDQDSD